jgi:S-adenosylmethionine hydrolase
VDRFGNAATNFPAVLAAKMQKPALRAGRLKITRFLKTYSDVPRARSLVVTDSQGYVEIAVCEGSAAKTYGLRTGQKVSLKDLGSAGNRLGNKGRS